MASSATFELQTIPEIVFIVPYRNRPQHKFYFSKYMTSILKRPISSYEIYFSHQCDARSFNRGATKNIGFLAVKHKYPNHYKNITFVFNDIDTIPFNDILNYMVTAGTAKHYYGFNYALGGIVAIKGGDFEKSNGYPNFWGWGMEDNVLQNRVLNCGINIDRNQFYKIGSPEILQLFDGVSRFINKKDPWRATHDTNIDGIKTIHKLNYSVDKTSNNPVDNIHRVEASNIFIINILSFMTGTRFEQDNYYKYDLRDPPRKIIHPSRITTNKTKITDDWSDIPYNPKMLPQSAPEQQILSSPPPSPPPSQPVSSTQPVNTSNVSKYNNKNSTSKYAKYIQICLMANQRKKMLNFPKK